MINNQRGPFLPNIEQILAMGFDPKTGLPLKWGNKAALKGDIKKALRIIDEQDATNRYLWKNTEPLMLTSQEIERMVYYKGQLSFFKMNEKYYITPYALDGTIDFYGRFNVIHPVPYAAGVDEKEGKIDATQRALLSTLKLECVYEIEEGKEYDPDKVCVLLHDYTKQLSQTIIPRVTVNDPILDTMAEFIPYMRTNALMSCGVKGVRVNDADQQKEVLEASKSIESCALTGTGWLPIVGAIEFQEIGDGNVGNCEQFMMAMQSVDNFRLSTYGIDNGGLFEKQSHILQSEADVNGGPVGLVLDDGLKIRKKFCDLVNKIFGLNISVDINPAIKQQRPEADKPMKDKEGGNDNEPTL